MTSKKYYAIPVMAGALGVGGAAMLARAAEPTAADLQAQIQSLQTKVQQLESQSPAQQQKTATVDSVLSDANKRSQLMQVEGFTAGHTGGDDGHFVIQSGDGNFRMVPWLQLQFRNALNFSEEAKSNGDDTFEDGFEISRAKLGFMGNVFSPDITYNINWASGENNGGSSLVLENAYMQFHCPQHDAWSLRIGQWKDVVFHEENVSSKRQLAVR